MGGSSPLESDMVIFVEFAHFFVCQKYTTRMTNFVPNCNKIIENYHSLVTNFVTFAHF